MCEHPFQESADEQKEKEADKKSSQSESEEEEENEDKLSSQFYVNGKNLIDMSYMHLATKSANDSCGYCKSKKENPGSATYGIGAPRLSVEDY
jgi:hypothetical protein